LELGVVGGVEVGVELREEELKGFELVCIHQQQQQQQEKRTTHLISFKLSNQMFSKGKIVQYIDRNACV
jgi:hypothetical protein